MHLYSAQKNYLSRFALNKHSDKKMVAKTWMKIKKTGLTKLSKLRLTVVPLDTRLTLMANVKGSGLNSSAYISRSYNVSVRPMMTI